MDFVCFDESLNIYLDKCLDIISISDCFSIAHIFRHDIEEQMSWHSKHPAIMLIMMYCSRADVEFSNIGEAELETTVSATNGKFYMEAKARIAGSSLFIIYKILAKGWTS